MTTSPNCGSQYSAYIAAIFWLICALIAVED